MPLVGMGMEYSRMNNLPLAQQLFNQVSLLPLPTSFVHNFRGVFLTRFVLSSDPIKFRTQTALLP